MAEKSKEVAPEATNTIKVDEDVLVELRTIRNSQQQLQLEIGGMEAHKATLVGELLKLATSLKEKMTSLEEKYGKGNLSLDTGIITPLPENTEENVNT